MKAKNILQSMLGGKILEETGFISQWKFVLYLFSLVIIYISINFSMENSLVQERRNQKEIKNLKADYTSKSAKLLFSSKRIEIEKKLMDHGSKLIAPEMPPKEIITEE